MSIIEQIKKELRISHADLDELFAQTVEEARADMVRAGLSAAACDEDDPAVCRCIKDYCLAVHGHEALHDRYELAYKYELDCLRKSEGYRVEPCSMK